MPTFAPDPAGRSPQRALRRTVPAPCRSAASRLTPPMAAWLSGVLIWAVSGSLHATVPLYFPGQIPVVFQSATAAVASFRPDAGEAYQLVAGRDDGFLARVVATGGGSFNVADIFEVGGRVVKLEVIRAEPGQEVLLGVATANPDRIHILAFQGGSPPFRIVASVALDEDPGEIRVGPIGPAGSNALAVTQPGSDRWLLVEEVGAEWGIGQELLAGDRPLSVAILDVDGDEISEVVTADNGVLSETLTVYRKDDQQHFQLADQLSAPGAPVAIVAFDQDGDLSQELYVTYADQAFISVYEAELGSLVETTRIAASAPSDGLLLARMTPEKNALWTWNADRGAVLFFEEQGSGWEFVETFYSGGRAGDVALTDMNNDGFADLAVANGESRTVALLFGNDEPSLRAYLVSLLPADPISTLLFDEDFDGDLDQMVACLGSSTVEILRGDGLGHLFPDPQPLTLEYAPRAIATVLADADTLRDLAISQAFSDQVRILRRLPAGGYANLTTLTAGDSPFLVRSGDLDDDGFEDLAIANEASDDVALFFGAGDGTFLGIPHIPHSGRIRGMELAHLNEDQLLDLIIVDRTRISSLINLGDRVFGQQRFYGIGIEAVGMALADFDGDQDLDAVVAKDGDDGLAIVENIGDGELFVQNRTYALQARPSNVTTGDVDLNGWPDVIVTMPDGSEVKIVRNLGNWIFAPALSFVSALQPQFASMGDLNSDEIPDLVILDGALNLALTMLNIEPNPVSATAPSLSAACLPAGLALDFQIPAAEGWRLEGRRTAGWVTLAADGAASQGELQSSAAADWMLRLTIQQIADIGLERDHGGRYQFRLATRGGTGATILAAAAGDCWHLPPADTTEFLRLSIPHPNPFNPELNIGFELGVPGQVTACIFDLGGRKIATLTERWYASGTHFLQWDGRAETGTAAAGTYLLSISGAGRTLGRKVTLLK